jgi:hypothetical protein
VDADVHKYAGRRVDVLVKEPTYRLWLDDFDPIGDIKFDEGPPQRFNRGGWEYN